MKTFAIRLEASKEINIRFSEVDSMNFVWHGAYALYLEDARETFGNRYGLGYLDIFANGYYAPLVDLSISYKKPLVYGTKAQVEIVYRPTEAAKILFDYRICNLSDRSLIATASTVQVFLDKNYQLVWGNPPFYEAWKQKMGLL
ncbi:MAG: acyl-CoA thioesterase [Tannerellaceae bacterium]|jgi:acyl-CoA thioester hydrolase|nr:acyl-CoA thioesterase [Tannerellaceae bacterium]